MIKILDLLNKEKGFTLMEILMAVGVLSILVLMALPQINIFIDQSLYGIQDLINTNNSLENKFAKVYKDIIKNQFPTNAVFLTGGDEFDIVMQFDNGSKIYGDIAVDTSDVSLIQLEGGKQKEGIFYIDKTQLSLLPVDFENFTVQTFTQEIKYTMPEFPSPYSDTLTSENYNGSDITLPEGNYDYIGVEKNGVINVENPTSDTQIGIRNFDLRQGNIELVNESNNHITFFVEEGLYLDNSAKINPKPENGNISIVSKGDIYFEGGSSVNGLIYAPYSTVHLTGGSEVEGAVIAEKIVLEGGSSITYNADYIGTIDNILPFFEIKE